MPELRELAAQVLAEADAPGEPFGVYAFNPEDEASELARSIERSAFDEFFGNSPELLAQEYGPYEHATVFLCVIDQRRSIPAGMMRLVFPSSDGLKSLAEVEPVWREPLDDVLTRTDPPLELDRAIDIATFAVDSEYRGRAAQGLIGLSLYQSVAQAAGQCGLRWVVTILDLRVLHLLQRAIAAPFEFFPGVEPIEYLGSEASAPVYADLVKYFARLEAEDPTLREIIADGHGLEPSVRPTSWGSTLSRVMPDRHLRIA